MQYTEVPQTPGKYVFHPKPELPTWALIVLVLTALASVIALVLGFVILMMIINVEPTDGPFNQCNRLSAAQCSLNTSSLTVNQDARIGGKLTVQGNVYGASFVTPSSSLIKQNMTEATIGETSGIFRRIKPYRFRYIQGYAAIVGFDPNRFYFGLSADQLARDIPEADLTIEEEIKMYENQTFFDHKTNLTSTIQVLVDRKILMIRRERLIDLLIDELLNMYNVADALTIVNQQQSEKLIALDGINVRQDYAINRILEIQNATNQYYQTSVNGTLSFSDRIAVLEAKVISLMTKPPTSSP